MPRGSLALAVTAALVMVVGCRPSGNPPPQPAPVGGPEKPSGGPATNLPVLHDPDRSSPEMELARLKREIAAIDKDENAIKNDLAKSIATQDKAARGLTTLRSNTEAAKEQLRALSDAVREAELTGGGRTAELRAKLEAKVKEYKALAKQVEDTELVFKQREEEKGVLYSRLETVQQVRTELHTAADELQVALKLPLKRPSEQGTSKLGDIRESIKRLEDKTAEKRARVGLDAPGSEPKQDVLKEVDDILGKPAK